MPALQTEHTLVVVIPFVSDTYVYDSVGALTVRVSNLINTKKRKSLDLASALDDEVPGLHHGEVGRVQPIA